MVSRPQEVSTDAEQILHDTVNRREPLELSGRLETPHLAFPLSGRLMGNLRAVVRVLIGAVKHRWHHRATGGRVTAQLIGNQGSGRPGSLLTLAPHRSGRAGSAASGSSTDSVATRRRVPAGPGSQAMATAIPQACLASSAIRCRDVETGPNLGVLAVFPSNAATCRGPLPSTGSRGLNSPASAVL